MTLPPYRPILHSAVRRTLLGVLGAGGLAASLPETLWAAAPGATTRGIESQRIADQGDGSFLNPILAGDHPDPTILRDGDDYYLTCSSFEAYPGLLLWHSRDLVNWRPLGPALRRNIGSVWAPELVKHDGWFYLYIPTKKTAAPG